MHLEWLFPICFGGIFVFVFSGAFIGFAYMILMSILYAPAVTTIMNSTEKEFMTKVVIDQEMAKRYPKLFKMKMYAPIVVFGGAIVCTLLIGIILLVL